MRNNTCTGNPSNAVRSHPTGGGGAAHPITTHGDSWGGPSARVGRTDQGMAEGGPRAPYKIEGQRVLAPPNIPPPLPSCSTPSTYSGPRIYKRGGATQPPSGGSPWRRGGTRLTVAHFRKEGPIYDDALSQLDDIQGPLLLMLATDPAAALRRELDGYD